MAFISFPSKPDLNPLQCDFCGKKAEVHSTEIQNGVPIQHHYCWDHVPSECDMKKPSAEDEAKLLDNLIPRVDAQDIDDAQKEQMKNHLRQLLDKIRAGRRKLE
jgi:hypothetical protein